jgi:hypothetical protein
MRGRWPIYIGWSWDLHETRTRLATPIACRETYEAASIIRDMCPWFTRGLNSITTHPGMSYPNSSRHARPLFDIHHMSLWRIAARILHTPRHTRQMGASHRMQRKSHAFYFFFFFLFQNVGVTSTPPWMNLVLEIFIGKYEGISFSSQFLTPRSVLDRV